MSEPDTADLRTGAPIDDALLALLPLVGVWRGTGAGSFAGAEFAFGQEVVIAHDGRPFLAYESRSWVLDDTGSVIGQAGRERGFWRPGAGEDDVSLTLATDTGQALVFAGLAGDARWELATVSAAQAPGADTVDGERRLYAVLNEELVYATELSPSGRPFVPHLNGRLARV